MSLMISDMNKVWFSIHQKDLLSSTAVLTAGLKILSEKLKNSVTINLYMPI